eukprot:Sdes_comp14417_c0_seq1m3476
MSVVSLLKVGNIFADKSLIPLLESSKAKDEENIFQKHTESSRREPDTLSDSNQQGWSVPAEDWGWGDENPTEKDSQDASDSMEDAINACPRWYKDCGYSISPGCDCIAIFHGQIFVVISATKSRLDNLGGCEFQVTGRGSGCDFGPAFGNDIQIQDVVCLPVALPASGSASSAHKFSRTCIIVAYSSGHVRVFFGTRAV